MKNLNAQLGSWAELRHDNLLYVEPVYDFACGCSYPTGFVEPRIKVWKAIEEMALVAANILQNVPFPKSSKSNYWRSPEEIQINQVKFYQLFSKHMRVLHDISVKELNQQPLDEKEANFLKYTMEDAGFMSGMSRWSGWYCELYYSLSDADDEDPIVCDVFTNTPDREIGDPGSILHEGLGFPRAMLVCVDNGAEKITYSGPIYSYYEFNTPYPERLSDKAWSDKLQSKDRPPVPEWTHTFFDTDDLVVVPKLL